MHQLWKDKRQIPWRTSRGLNWENKTYKLQCRKVFLAASSLSSAPNLVRGVHTRVCWAGREKRVPSVTARQTKRKERLLVVYEKIWSLSLLGNIVPTKVWKDQVRVIFVWPWNMVSVSVSYLFYQPIDEKFKTWTLHFLPKKGIVRVANRVAVWRQSEVSIDF